MSSFVLKMIAIISMFVDHIGYGIFGKFSYFNYIGRLAFPIFAFQISEGYIYTKNLKKYFFRLFFFALISQIPFMLFCSIISSEFSLNIFFTLLLGLSCIFIYDKSKYKSLGIIASIAIGFVAQISNCDYGFYGVAIILIFHIFKNNFINASIFFIIATSIKYLIPIIQYGFYNVYLYLFICTLIPLLFLAAYNNKKGRNTKYLLYLFYPLHLLLIYGISLLK
ncbi:MAG: conjugal transfer protein TraX [Clostridia bacterium]|nr:conjugal transfer protein TraX [Clostridia bacterium]